MIDLFLKIQIKTSVWGLFSCDVSNVRIDCVEQPYWFGIWNKNACDFFFFFLTQEQKRREMILARELKKPVEDMVLKDSKVTRHTLLYIEIIWNNFLKHSDFLPDVLQKPFWWVMPYTKFTYNKNSRFCPDKHCWNHWDLGRIPCKFGLGFWTKAINGKEHFEQEWMKA